MLSSRLVYQCIYIFKIYSTVPHGDVTETFLEKVSIQTTMDMMLAMRGSVPNGLRTLDEDGEILCDCTVSTKDSVAKMLQLVGF